MRSANQTSTAVPRRQTLKKYYFPSTASRLGYSPVERGMFVIRIIKAVHWLNFQLERNAQLTGEKPLKTSLNLIKLTQGVE